MYYCEKLEKEASEMFCLHCMQDIGERVYECEHQEKIKDD